MGKKAQHREATENRLLAMAHPLRADIFKILTERSASPADLTRALGLPRKELPNVSYHAKYLVELGCAEVIETRVTPGRPAATVYKATERSLVNLTEWEKILAEDPVLAEHLLGEAMQVQLDDYLLALRAKTVGRDGRWHMSRTRRVLDIEGLCEAVEYCETVRRGFDEIERRAAERRAEDGSDAIHISSSLGLFPVPPPSQADPDA